MTTDLGHIPLHPPATRRMSLATVRRGAAIKPPKIVIYGTPGIGKTTFAAGAPNPIFLQTEDGLGLIDAARFGDVARTYQDVLDAITVLLEEPHDFQSLVVDSLDQLEPLIWDHVCQREGKKNIEAFGYGRGYQFAADELRVFLSGLDAIRDRGMTVVVVAHSEIRRFESPEHEPFDRYQMRLHKLANDIVCEWADALLFASYKVHVVRDQVKGQERSRGAGKGDRVIYTEERPAFRAKNRYRLPPELPLSWDAFQGAIGASVDDTNAADITTTN